MIGRVVSFSTALDRPRPPGLPFLSQRPSSLQSVRISLLPSCLSTLPHSPPPVIRPYRPFIDNKKLSSFLLPRADTRPTTPKLRSPQKDPIRSPTTAFAKPLAPHPPSPQPGVACSTRQLEKSSAQTLYPPPPVLASQRLDSPNSRFDSFAPLKPPPYRHVTQLQPFGVHLILVVMFLAGRCDQVVRPRGDCNDRCSLRE